MQPEQEVAIVLAQTVGARALAHLGAGAAQLREHVLAADLRRLGEADLAGFHRLRRGLLGEVGGLVGETGDAFGNLAPRRLELGCGRRRLLASLLRVYFGCGRIESGVAGALNARR